MSEFARNDLSQRICVAVLSFIQKHERWQEALRELSVAIDGFQRNNAEMISEEESAQAFVLRLEENVAEFPSENVPKSTFVARQNGRREQERLLRLEEVEARTGFRKTSIYKWMDENGFPKPVKFGSRSVRWVAAEVDQWIKQAGSKSLPPA